MNNLNKFDQIWECQSKSVQVLSSSSLNLRLITENGLVQCYKKIELMGIIISMTQLLWHTIAHFTGPSFMLNMAIRVVEFSSGGYKIRMVLWLIDKMINYSLYFCQTVYVQRNLSCQKWIFFSQRLGSWVFKFPDFLPSEWMIKCVFFTLSIYPTRQAIIGPKFF